MKLKNCQVMLMLFIFSFAFLIPAISKAETIPAELCSAPYRGFCTDEEEAGPDGNFEPSPWTEESTKTGGKKWVVRGKNVVVASCPDGRFGKLKVEKITCPGGCLNGECECLDTDVDNDKKSRNDLKGTTTGAIGPYDPRGGATHEDFCTTFYYENPMQIAPGTEDRGSFYPPGTTFEIQTGPCLDGTPGPCYFGSKYSSSPSLSYSEFKALKEKFEKGDEKAYRGLKDKLMPEGTENEGNAVIDGSCLNQKNVKLDVVPCQYGCVDGACIEPACRDSDGGNLIEVGGSVIGLSLRGLGVEEKDYCTNNGSNVVEIGTHVVEKVCDKKTNRVRTLKPQRCSGKCNGGRCEDVCELLAGSKVSKPIRVVLVGGDLGEGYDLEVVFSDLLEKTFKKTEPFKSYLDSFSFWFVNEQIPQGEIIYDSDDNIPGSWEKMVQQNMEIVGSFADSCGPRDITIFVTGKYGWGTEFTLLGRKGTAGFVPGAGIPFLFFTIDYLSTLIHELGHGYCNLGHSHGGVSKETTVYPNCGSFEQDPSKLKDRSLLKCPAWKGFPQPSCFQGCGNTNNLARLTYSSIMGYASLPGFPNPNPYVDKFNLVECSACLSKITGESTDSALEKCKGIPGILGHQIIDQESGVRKFFCDQDADCSSLGGFCGGYCDKGDRVCRFDPVGKFCFFQIVANEKGYHYQSGGKCDGKGNCVLDKKRECFYPTDCYSKDYYGKCVKDCDGGKCILEPDNTEIEYYHPQAGSFKGRCCNGILCEKGNVCNNGVCQNA